MSIIKNKREPLLGVWSRVALLDDQQSPKRPFPNYKLVSVPRACCGCSPVAPLGPR